jgi:hypothetical protein
MRCHASSALGPVMRTMEIAALPGAVDGAKMVLAYRTDSNFFGKFREREVLVAESSQLRMHSEAWCRLANMKFLCSTAKQSACDDVLEEICKQK